MRKLPLAAATAALLALPAAAEIPSKQVSKTLPLAAGEKVEVDTYKGSVKVTAWDKAEVAVAARVEADPECGSATQQARWVDETEVRIEKAASAVSIVSSYDRFDESAGWFTGCTARPFVHYTIQVPKGASLRIKDYKSDLIVKGLSAGLHVETYKGQLDVEGHEGAFDVETYKGNVRATLTRLAGEVRAETYKGSIAVRIPAASAFELEAESGRGTLNVEFAAPLSGRGGRHRGLVASGPVNGGGPRVSLKTEKGTIALRKV